MTLDQAVFILVVLTLLIVLLISFIMIQKWTIEKKNGLQGVIRDYVFKRYFDGEETVKRFNNRFFFDVFIDIETQVQIENDIRNKIVDDLIKIPFTKHKIKELNHFNSVKRRVAIFYVAQLKTEESINLLKKRFVIEKNESVKYFLAYHLIHHLDQQTVDKMIQSIINSSEHYQRWMRQLCANHYVLFKPYLNDIFMNQEKEVAYLVLEIASRYLEKNLKECTLRIFNESFLDQDLRIQALRVLTKQYPDLVTDQAFLNHEELWVRKMSILASGETHSEKMINKLLDLGQNIELEEEITQALSNIVFDSKTLFLYLIELYVKQKSRQVKKVIVRVLANDIDYLILKLKSGGYDYILQILDMIMELHIIEDLIDFVNHNKDRSLEKIYMPLIKRFAASDSYISEQCQIYMKSEVLIQMGLLKKPQPVIPREQAPLEKSKIIWITLWITLGTLLLPVLAILLNLRSVFSGEVNFWVALIVSINKYLVIYFLSVNSIYLILLLISMRGASDRVNLWEIKKDTMLFETRLLPSISIIAPAYNEEKSIVESVTSLLNLKYPTYEVIVVNDGSKDKTIDVLIKHFKLERKHPFFKQSINTKALRGVYINKQIPNLIVIDKQNGGKADALNLGINVAKYDYVCGIDADSLLEEDSLLKLMSVTLDDTKTHIALGGNIVPVNGCVVDQGSIEKEGLGKQSIVKFQTIEYLRAFTTGRIGWSKINSLLIISGAFGLFQRKALIKTGGYLTISGELKKDTVGD